MKQMKIAAARTLKNCIGIVSTGGPISPDRERLGLEAIKSLGFNYIQPMASSKYYADYTYDFSNGSSEMRTEAIKTCLNDLNVDCILAARGASGSFDVIDKISFSSWSDSKKLLIGCSDVTSLLVQLPFKYGLPSIHSVTLGSSFADYNTDSDAKESVDCLIRMLREKTYRQTYLFKNKLKFLKPIEGRFLAGNLTMLCSLLGTPYDIDYQGVILILEEVGEAPYRVKRMLEQLYFSGKFSKISALCYGRFSKCESANGPSVERVIEDFCNNRLADYDFPIVSGLEVGHWGKSLPVPLGCMGLLKQDELVQLESPIGN